MVWVGTGCFESLWKAAEEEPYMRTSPALNIISVAVTVAGLAGCNIDAAAADIYARYTTGGEAGADGGNSAGEGASSSGGGAETRGGSTGEEESIGGSGAASAGSSGGAETGSTGGSESGTTGAVAVCGDGVVAGAEECDDPGDPGCSHCVRDRLVFVTSGYVRGDLALGGGLTYWCNHYAAMGGLLENDEPRFKPWISTSEASAAESLYHSPGRYVLVNGLVFAESWDDLVAGKILNPLNVDEKSETQGGGVWSGTAPDGSAVPDTTHCEDWTSDSAFLKAYQGNTSAVDGRWTQETDPELNPYPCLAENSLYCFESP